MALHLFYFVFFFFSTDPFLPSQISLHPSSPPVSAGPSSPLAFVRNVVTFVHYPGCWLPAALFCDLTAAFLRMGPFTWAAEHGWDTPAHMQERT